MTGVERLAAKMIGIGFGGNEVTAEARALITRGVRNVIFFARNAQSPEQFARLTFDVKSLTSEPLAASIDQEGGRVMRLREPFSPVPSMRDVGKAGDEKLAGEIGRVLGREIRAVNVDIDLAPVLDVDTNPANPVISARSFGPAVEMVTKLGVALLRGLQHEGVAACAKHFPGHGDTSADSHHELPVLPNHDLDRLTRVELPPFKAAIDAGVATVMTAHVIYRAIDPRYVGTLSSAIMDQLLRRQLGFDRLLMSDDMQMKAIADHYGFEEALVHGINAGVDLFWICHSPELQNRAIETIIKAVETGQVLAARLVESSRRMDELFARWVRPARPEPDRSVIGCAAHRAVVAEIERRAGGLSRGDDPTEAFVRTQKT